MTGAQLTLMPDLFPADTKTARAVCRLCGQASNRCTDNPDNIVCPSHGLIREKAPQRGPERSEPEPGFWDDAELISSYSRAQALEDGELVDLSEWARETGFRYPVACTRALWAKIEAPKRSHQDTRGRAHDVLYLLFVACKFGGSRDTIRYRVKLGRRNETIKSVCGPGDDAEPVITMMLPEES